MTVEEAKAVLEKLTDAESENRQLRATLAVAWQVIQRQRHLMQRLATRHNVSDASELRNLTACEGCPKLFRKYRDSQRFCSAGCRNRAWRRRHRFSEKPLDNT